jgi:hypothetical protein
MDWDKETAQRSIALLLTLDFELACPSHGNPVRKETLATQFAKGVSQVKRETMKKVLILLRLFRPGG